MADDADAAADAAAYYCLAHSGSRITRREPGSSGNDDGVSAGGTTNAGHHERSSRRTHTTCPATKVEPLTMAAAVAYGSEQQVREAARQRATTRMLSHSRASLLRRLVGRDSHGPCEYDVRLMGWIGLDWIGLDWIGLDWIGLGWIGLDI